MSSENSAFSPSGHLEFEYVEIEPPKPKQAATATPVDETIDNDPLSINFGRKKDHKPAAAERMLAGPTIDWLVAFPMDARPKALCDRYPHVANRLAQCWSQAARSMAAVKQLAEDPRWGGVGYPAGVQMELQRLLKLLGGGALSH
jgi:hypothetical protein